MLLILALLAPSSAGEHPVPFLSGTSVEDGVLLEWSQSPAPAENVVVQVWRLTVDVLEMLDELPPSLGGYLAPVPTATSYAAYILVFVEGPDQDVVAVSNPLYAFHDSPCAPLVVSLAPPPPESALSPQCLPR